MSGDKDIKQSLSILLGTTLGERFLHPAFGCNLKYYLFGPLSTTTKTIIRDMIKTAIVRHEPRIDFLGLKLNTEMEANGTLLIEIDYRIRSTNARSNLVYPFYLEEGTNV